LKRGAGGTVDIEFAIQLLQLIHGKQFPLVFQPGTLQAIQALAEVGVLSKSDSVYFTQAYQFLRGIESRLRLQNTTARHDFPEELSALEQLAYLLRVPSADTLVETLGYFRTENRQRWRALVSQFTNLPD
jgi:glutamate-ammonia-ligase adenylyltransferase